MAKAKRRGKGSDIAALIQSVVESCDSEYVGTFFGDNQLNIVEEWIPSTSMSINYLAGDPRYGAFPQGRIITILGPKSSAKSLILYDAGMQVQKLGGIFVLIDSESSYSKGFGVYLGIHHKQMIYAHLRYIEEVTDFAYNTIDKARAINQDCPILIGWDSLAACTTIKEDEEDDEDSKSEMGLRARLMGRQMRKLGGVILRESVTYIVINQTRKKLGVMFGKTTTSPGGEALPFHSSLILEVYKAKKLKRSVGGKKIVIGHKVGVFCEKNKVRPPFAQTEINVYVDKSRQRYGLDRWSGMVELLRDDGIITIKKNICTIVNNPKIKFNEKDIDNYWEEYILPNIPEDLYKGTIAGEKDESNDEEDGSGKE